MYETSGESEIKSALDTIYVYRLFHTIIICNIFVFDDSKRNYLTCKRIIYEKSKGNSAYNILIYFEHKCTLPFVSSIPIFSYLNSYVVFTMARFFSKFSIFFSFVLSQNTFFMNTVRSNDFGTRTSCR